MVQPVDNWVFVGRSDHQPDAPAGAMAAAAAAAGAAGAGPNQAADVDRLRELFSQFDRPFLERVYHECGGDLNRAIEHCLELTSRTDSGAAGRALPGAPAPPVAPSADQHHLVGADMAVDYKAITPTPTPTPGTPSMSGASTPVRASAPWPGPSRGASGASLAAVQLPSPAVVEHRRAQLRKITTFLQSIGIHEHREFFLQNPRALNDLRALLQQLGLGEMNFPQLSEYFRQAGLTFGPTQPPSVPPDFVRNLLQVARHSYETYTFGDQLTPQQKENFVRDGFVHMRNIVKRPLIDAALRDINRSLGCGYTREQRLLFDRLTWCPELVAVPSVLDLLYMSPALALAMSLIGPVARVQSGVIQARYPGFGCADPMDERVRALVGPSAWPLNPYVPWPHWPQLWTIDNLPNEYNGVPKKMARNYTCMLTVFLTECTTPLSGNLGVFVGGHNRVQQALRAAGGVQRFLDDLKDLHDLRRVTSLTSDPVQVMVQPGDIVISHYSLPLVAVPNISPHVRIMVSFRLHHASHVPGVYRPDAMDDIWLEFDGLRELVPQRPLPLPAAPASPAPSAPPATGPAMLAAAAALLTMPTVGAGKPRQCAACGTPSGVATARFCANCGHALPPA